MADPDAEDPREPTLIDPARAMTERLPAVGPIPSPEPPPGGGTLLADRYRLERVVGRGATSVVWAATDERLARRVACKILRQEHLEDGEVAERFRREAMVVARLGHPGIIHVLDADVTPGGGFIAMQLLEGGSLADRLDGTPWPATDVARLGTRVLEALQVAHDAGVVHRDIKPGNILFATPEDDEPVLTDFGVAKVLLGEESLRTATGVIIGTAAYLAPEQALGEDLDARADLYAVGCVLFQCLTGRQPFGGDSPVQVASARIGRQVRPSQVLPSVPRWIDDVVARAMTPDRADRWPDAATMAAALHGSSSSSRIAPPSARESPVAPPSPTPATAAPTARPVVRRGRFARLGGLPVVAATCLVLAVLVLALAGLLDGDESGGEVAEESPTTTPTDGAGDLVAPAAAVGFDPQGDGEEHSDDAPLVLDGERGTAWRSEGYDTAAFGNLKDGVGVVVELSAPTALSAVRIMALNAPAEVRVAPARPTTLEETTVVGTVGPGDHEVALEGIGEVGAVLLWITGPLPTVDGRHRAVVGEVQLVAG